MGGPYDTQQTLVILFSSAHRATPAMSTTIEEMIVNARKRAESIQDIPVAVTALTAAEPEIGGVEEIIARSNLLWEPSEDFQVKLKITYSDREGDHRGMSQKISCYTPTQTTSDCALNDKASFPVPIDLLGRYPDVDPFDNSTTKILSLDLDWAISDQITLNSITGNYDIEQEYFGPVTPWGGTDVDIFGLDGMGNPIFLLNPLPGWEDRMTIRLYGYVVLR